MKESGAQANIALKMLFLKLTSLTVDFGKPTCTSASLHAHICTMPGKHNIKKLRYSVNNPDEARSTEVYPPS